LLVGFEQLRQRGNWKHEQLVISRVEKEEFLGAEIIGSKLYLGCYPTSLQFSQLKSKGISHIISIAREVQLPPFSAESFNITYLILKGFDSPDYNLLPFFELTNSFIDEAISNNSGVYVHCMAGASRSATIVASYLIKTHNITTNHALRILKGKRAIVNPNPGFIKQLREYEQYIKEKDKKQKEKKRLKIETEYVKNFVVVRKEKGSVELKYIFGSWGHDYIEHQITFFWDLYDRHFVPFIKKFF